MSTSVQIARAEQAPDATAEVERLKAEAAKHAWTLRKREWLLETMERQRLLSPHAQQIERRIGLSTEEFFENYYTAHRPVILVGEMTDWPALSRWTPAYLRSVVGSRTVQYQGGRNRTDRFELVKDPREIPFDKFIDM